LVIVIVALFVIAIIAVLVLTILIVAFVTQPRFHHPPVASASRPPVRSADHDRGPRGC